MLLRITLMVWLSASRDLLLQLLVHAGFFAPSIIALILAWRAWRRHDRFRFYNYAVASLASMLAGCGLVFSILVHPDPQAGIGYLYLPFLTGLVVWCCLRLGTLVGGKRRPATPTMEPAIGRRRFSKEPRGGHPAYLIAAPIGVFLLCGGVVWRSGWQYEVPKVLCELARSRMTAAHDVRAIYEHRHVIASKYDFDVSRCLAANRNAPADVLEHLSELPAEEITVHLALARNPSAPSAVLERVAEKFQDFVSIGLNNKWEIGFAQEELKKVQQELQRRRQQEK